MQKSALITASETFGKYLINPSKWLAISAEGKIIAGHKIYSLIFPSIIRLPQDADDAGEVIIKKALDINANVIISFGLASEAKGFRVERTATNWIENDKYCPPYENRRPIIPTRPHKEQKQINNLDYWNLTKIKTGFKNAKIPFDKQISDNPGQYSCNSWMYRTLLAMENHNLKIPYLFVHTACTEEAIECITDFPRDKKVIIKREDLLTALTIFLKSYINP